MKISIISKKESVIYKGKIYGFEASLEVEDIIGKSLIERGYAKAIGTEEDEAEVMQGSLDAAQLADMTYPQLKKLAAEMGVDATGKKDELIERICGVVFEVEVSEDVQTSEDAENGVDASDLPNTSMPD